MNIQDAVKEALKINGYIKRKEWRTVKLKPTDSPDCCVVIGPEGRRGIRWNPCAKDLLVDDWVVMK